MIDASPLPTTASSWRIEPALRRAIFLSQVKVAAQVACMAQITQQPERRISGQRQTQPAGNALKAVAPAAGQRPGIVYFSANGVHFHCWCRTRSEGDFTADNVRFESVFSGCRAEIAGDHRTAYRVKLERAG